MNPKKKQNKNLNRQFVPMGMIRHESKFLLLDNLVLFSNASENRRRGGWMERESGENVRRSNKKDHLGTTILFHVSARHLMLFFFLLSYYSPSFNGTICK